VEVICYITASFILLMAISNLIFHTSEHSSDTSLCKCSCQAVCNG